MHRNIVSKFRPVEIRVKEGVGYVDHCVHNCNQPYDEMHQGLWLKIKFGFPQTGKGSPNFFEIGWQTPEIH